MIREFESVLGTRIIAASREDRPCLFVWTDYNVSPTLYANSCLTPDTDAVVHISIDESAVLPEPNGYVLTNETISASFPQGTVLRFELDGDRVIVDVIDPAHDVR